MNQLLRDTKVKLHLENDNKWIVKDVEGNLLIDSDSDYMIYMVNVNFKKGGLIEGRYLGQIDKDSSLLKVESAKNVTTDGEYFFVDGKKVMSAKMVVVNNKTSVIIVIASR